MKSYEIILSINILIVLKKFCEFNYYINVKFHFNFINLIIATYQVLLN